MKYGVVEKSLVDMKKVNAFISALAGVEAICKEMSNKVTEINNEKIIPTHQYPAFLEQKFNELKVSFSLAQNEGKKALKSIRDAVRKIV